MNPYEITWAQVRPLSGYVRLADARKINRCAQDFHLLPVIYAQFANRAAALQHLKGLKLQKTYRVTLFTDAQWGHAAVTDEGIIVKFTDKQKQESFLI